MARVARQKRGGDAKPLRATAGRRDWQEAAILLSGAARRVEHKQIVAVQRAE